MADLEVTPNKPPSPNVPLPPIAGVPFKNSSAKPQKPSVTISASNATNEPPGNAPPKAIEPKKPKKSLWVKIKDELVHYYHGFRLLGLETRIAGGICFRLLTGKTLTRRERNQLVRTVADIFRLVPFAVFIIVPFMELLLPVYLKFFPFMLPSTFKEKSKEEEKVRQKLKAKLEVARFLQETVMKTTTTASKSQDIPTIVEFQEFLKTVRQSGQLANTTDIVRFSRLFEDQVTLDSLDHAQLKALCQLLEINSIGPSNLLRFQLWLRVRQLRTEDKLIAKEGIDQIPSWELQTLSRNRGMRSIGLTEDRLRSQLSQWLELHLEKNVPISLLLLSRAMYLQDTTLPPEQQLHYVISVLPDSAAEEAAVKAVESTEDVDPKTKMDILRKEQKTIKAERAAARKAAEEEARKDSEVSTSEVLEDKAQPISPSLSEELKDTADTLVGKSVQEPLKPITPPVGTPQAPSPSSQVVTPAAETVIGEKVSMTLSTPLSPSPTLEAQKASEEEPVVSSKDLDSIKDAIESMVESKKALQDEQLLDLKADLEETVKMRQQHQKETAVAEEDRIKATPDAAMKAQTVKEKKEEVEKEDLTETAAKVTPSPASPEPVAVVEEKAKTSAELAAVAEKEVTEKLPEEKVEVKERAAAKKAAKAEKAVKRLGAHVDRLLDEIDDLMDKLRGEKQDILQEIRVQEDQAKAIQEANEEKRKQLLDNIRADQQRVVDINDVLASMQRLQKVAGSETEATQRWQRILDALDEDHDGKIEFKHLLPVLELFDKEKVELKTSQLSDVVEMFEKEDLLEEEEDQAEEKAGEMKRENGKPETQAPESPRKTDVNEKPKPHQ